MDLPKAGSLKNRPLNTAYYHTDHSLDATMSSHASPSRACLSEGRTDNLMRMLDDPLNFGLFPDAYCLVLMLDHFLRADNWRDAAKVI